MTVTQDEQIVLMASKLIHSGCSLVLDHNISVEPVLMIQDLPLLEVTGQLFDIKPGYYFPIYNVYVYPHAVGFENIVLRANVNSTTNNLDLLFLASNTPQLLQDQFSEVSLDGINGEHMGKWISLRGPMIRVLETCSVSFIIEERSTDLKNGILIANCILEPTVKQQPSLKCVFEGCGREFTRPFNLKSHLETHNPVRSRSHECPQCHAMFCRSQDLARHSQIHSRTMTFVCDGCQKTFSRKDALKRHLRTSKTCPESEISNQ